MIPEDLLLLPWRVGRRVGRTVYAVVGAAPSDADVLIGLLDHELLARAVVFAHNAALAESPLATSPPPAPSSPLAGRRWRVCAAAFGVSGEYDPACCRFPKSCSPYPYDEAIAAGNVADGDLEPR